MSASYVTGDKLLKQHHRKEYEGLDLDSLRIIWRSWGHSLCSPIQDKTILDPLALVWSISRRRHLQITEQAFGQISFPWVLTARRGQLRGDLQTDCRTPRERLYESPLPISCPEWKETFFSFSIFLSIYYCSRTEPILHQPRGKMYNKQNRVKIPLEKKQHDV